MCLQMMEQGPPLYQAPILKLLYEYLRLQDPQARGLRAIINSAITVVHGHIKDPLWKDAIDLLKLVVSSSAALVQPPTRGLPVVDLGLFNQTLPGPTLQFQIDLNVCMCVPHVHVRTLYNLSDPIILQCVLQM